MTAVDLINGSSNKISGVQELQPWAIITGISDDLY